MDKTAWIDREIRKVCPINGLNSDGHISFSNDATEDEKLAAIQILQSEDLESRYQLFKLVLERESALDRHLDEVANSYRYESIRTMVTYATSDHPTFGPEGRAAVKFRDAVYAYGIQVIADVQAGLRPIPTEEELLAGAPLITAYFQ